MLTYERSQDMGRDAIMARLMVRMCARAHAAPGERAHV